MKKGVLIALPLVLLLGGGGTVGLAVAGVINVPFLPFGKKKGPFPKDDGKGGPLAPLLSAAFDLAEKANHEKDRLAAITPPATKPTIDPGPGEEKLAGLWAQLPTDRLVALIDKWPEPKLGRILAQMDDDATAKLLAALPPARAASLSQALAVATDESAAKVRAKA